MKALSLPAAAFTTLATGAMLSTAAADDSVGGFYAALRGGVDFVGNTDLTARGPGIAFRRAEAEYDAGWNAGAAFGYRYGLRFAAEVEFIYRSADIDTVSSNGTTITDSGDLASTAFMVNGLYHFDTGRRWTSYLGAGIGFANEIDTDLEGNAGIGAADLEDDGIAVQAIAGVAYALNERLSVTGEARYFAVPGDLELSNGQNTVALDYDGFSLQAGISYRF